MSEGGYTTSSYGVMMNDDVRIDAYLRALRATIQPGVSSVIELGTGAGVVAFAALQAGAKRVVAVEPNDAIELAREIAVRNGIDGIEFIRAMSTEVEVEPADIIISDMRGVLPLYRNHIPSIVDARTRLLKPGGTLIAARDRIFAAPVTSQKTWSEAVGCWACNPLGLDMSMAQPMAAAETVGCSATQDDLLAAPHQIGMLDYYTVNDADLAAQWRCTASRDGDMHGLSVWFETDLTAQVSLSTAPGTPRMAYGRPLYLLANPLAVRAGEELEFGLRAHKQADGEYLWKWRGGVVGDRSRSFEQTTLDGAEVDLTKLNRVALDARPTPSERAVRLRFTLGKLGDGLTVAEIIAAFERQFPDHRDAATAEVSAIVAEHGRLP